MCSIVKRFLIGNLQTLPLLALVACLFCFLHAPLSVAFATNVMIVPKNNVPITEGSNAEFKIRISGYRWVEPLDPLKININVSSTGDFLTKPPPTFVMIGVSHIVLDDGTYAYDYKDYEYGNLSIPTKDDQIDERDGVISVEIVSGTGYKPQRKKSKAQVEVRDDDALELSVFSVSSAVQQDYRARFLIRASVASERDTKFYFQINDRCMGGAGYRRNNVLQAGRVKRFIDMHVSSKAIAECNRIYRKRGVAGRNIELQLLLDHDENAPDSYYVIHRYPMHRMNANYSLNADSNRASVPIIFAEVELENPDETPVLSIRNDRSSRNTGVYIETSNRPATDLQVNLDIRGRGGNFLSRDVPTSVVLKQGQWGEYFEVPLATDKIREPDGWITATIEPGAGYVVADVPDNSVELKVVDNDRLSTSKLEISDVIQVGIESVHDTIIEGERASFYFLSYQNFFPERCEYLGGSYTPALETDCAKPITVNVKALEIGNFLLQTAPTTVTVHRERYKTQNGQNYHIFNLYTMDDDVEELDGQLEVVILPGSNYSVDPWKNRATVRITDNDGGSLQLPVVSISSEKSQILEGGSARFILSRTGSKVENLTVALHRRITGDFGLDSESFTIEILANHESRELIIETTDDDFDEDDGGIALELQLSAEYFLANAPNDSAFVEVLDDEPTPIIVVVAGPAQTITEGEIARFLIVSDTKSARDLSIYVDSTITSRCYGPWRRAQRVTLPAGALSVPYDVQTEIGDAQESGSYICARSMSGYGYVYEPRYASESPHWDDEYKITILKKVDGPEVSIASSSFSATEGTPARFTVSTENASGSELSIHVSISEQYGQSEQVSERIISIPVDEQSATFEVATPVDEVFGTTGSVTATVLVNDSYNVNSHFNTASVDVIEGGGPPEISVETVTETVTEGTPAWFLISASRASVEDLAVNVEVIGTNPGVLQLPPPETATIWANYTTVFLRVKTVNNMLDEDDSTVTLTLVPGENYTLDSENSTATATVEDNDEPPPTLSISAADESIVEGGEASFEIRADKIPDAALTVNIRVTESGNFISGDPPESHEFGTSSGTSTLLVLTADDDADEEDGAISVELRSGEGYLLGAEQEIRAEVAVTDNDGIPEVSISTASETVSEGDSVEFEISILSQETNDLEISASVNVLRGQSETATVRSVTVQSGETSAMIEIPTFDDQFFGTEARIAATLLESEAYSINPLKSTVEVTVVDNEDAPEISIESVVSPVTEGSPVWYLVSSTRSSSFDQNINVLISEWESDFLVKPAPSSVTLASYHRMVFVSLDTLDDETFEENGTVRADILNGESYTVSRNSGSATVEVLDNDFDVPVPSLSVSSYIDSVVEGGVAPFVIRASQSPISTLTVNLHVSQSGEFISGEAPASAEIYPDSDFEIILVRTLDDENYEEDGSVTVRIMEGEGYAVSDSPANSASIAIRDNDATLRYPEISITAVGASVVEGDTAEFAITSSRSVDADLTVNLALNPTGGFFEEDISSSSTATIANGEISTTFEVETQDDDIEEFDGSITVTVISDPNDSISYRVSSENHFSTVAITDDDDTTVLSISAVTTPVVENTGEDSETGTETKAMAEFTIASTKSLLTDLTINVDVQETGSMVEGTLPETVELPAGQSSVVLRLGIEDDDVNEVESRITVNLEAGTKYGIAESPYDSAFVDVRDNDQITLTPRVYNNYLSFKDEDSNGPWKDYLWGLYEGLPAIMYFQDDGGKTAGRDLTINFEVTDSESKLIGPLPTSTVLKANADRANSIPIPTVCNEAREPNSRITVTLKEGDGYVFDESRKKAEGYLLDIEFGSEGLNTCPSPRKVSIAPADDEVSEGGTVRFNITADAHERRDYFVKYEIANEVGNFMESTDVRVHTVRIEVGTRSASSPVFRIGDNEDLDQETGVISATIIAGEGYVAGESNVARVSVLDNDGGDSGDRTYPVASIAAVSDEIEEGDNATFTVSLNTEATSELNVNVSWTVEGNFLTAGSRILTISTGRIVSLGLGATAENAVPEPDGSVTATIGIGTGYQVNSRQNSDTIAILDDDATPEPSRSGALHQEVLTNLLDGTSERSVDTVSDRVEFAFNNPGETKFELNGANTINDFVTNSGRKVNEDGMDLNILLSGSSFTLPLLPDGNAATSVTLWGIGFNRNVSDRGDDSSINWEGESFTGHLGLDARFDEGLLVGVVSATDDSSVNFIHEDNEGELSGSYSVRMTSIQPYLAWASEDLSTQLRGSVGYGIGEVGIDYDHYDPEFAGSRRYSASIGGSDLLYSSDSLFDGALSELTVEAEAWMSRQSVTGNGLSIVGTEVDTRSLRIVAEGSLQTNFDTGSTFSPAVSVEGRWDGGEGNTGMGIEMAGRADYQNPAGFEISGLGRMLVSNLHSNGEKGLKGELSYDPEHDGIGVLTTLSPAWGALNDTGIQQLWDDGVVENGTSQANDGARLETEIGYGFSILDGGAVLAPYLKTGLFEHSGNRYGVGSRFNHVSGMAFEFEGTHEPHPNGGSDRKVKLQGSIGW